MKRRLLCLLLITGLLLTGCGEQDDTDANGGHVASENYAEGGETNTSNAVAENADADATTDSESAEEPYILTFEASTIDGEAFTSEKFAQSKLTMINVWATYCNPCLNEMPDLGEIAASYDAADFQMIGIISDCLADAEAADVEYAKELITETGANYPHLLLNESLYLNLVGAVEAVPTTFFVNQEGEMLGYVTGAQSKEVWEELINGLLEEEQ